MLKDIGKKIVDTRKKKGWTQEELAGKAKLHNTYIGAVERGEVNLSLKSLEKIANALSLPVIEFFRPVKFSIPQTEKEKIIDEISNRLRKQKVKNLELISKVIKDVLIWQKK